MRYEAKIENNIVTDTIVCDDTYVNNMDGHWIVYNNYDDVSVGYTHTETEGFRPPKPFDSWIWNETNKYWDSPTPLPDEEDIYEWDETTQSWIMTYKKI